jgi:hypothetical protein
MTERLTGKVAFITGCGTGSGPRECGADGE